MAGSSDPVEIIKGFSDFQQIDLGRVLNGDILSERGSLMVVSTVCLQGHPRLGLSGRGARDSPHNYLFHQV